MKILFLINTVTSYQNNFYNELSKREKIKVIVLNKNYKNYNFKISENFYEFIEEEYDKKNKIKNIIDNFGPSSIIFGGYRLKYIFFIKKIIQNKNIKVYYWLERFDISKSMKISILNLLFKRLLSKSHGILAIGQEAKNFYKRYNKNVINLPYSIKYSKKIKKTKFKNKKIRFLFVGQLIYRKGIDLIINLLKKNQYQNFEIKIVGEGIYSKEILNLSKKNKNIAYFKFQNLTKLKKIYLNSDVMIFPSRFDGWGVVALEAMNYMLAIISSQNVGVKEVFPKKKIIIKPTEKELDKKIKFLLKNPELIKNLGIQNKTSLKNSICNSKNSVKIFIKYIKT